MSLSYLTFMQGNVKTIVLLKFPKVRSQKLEATLTGGLSDY
jgi:hypothetical protein